MTSTSQSLEPSALSRPLVIGASGLVGGAFLRCLARAGRVRGTWHRHRRPGLEHFSLDQNPAVFLDRCAPTLVVLASALTHVDYCETHPDETFALNVDAVRPVVAWCRLRNVPLLFFSSDYVFDGSGGPYAENAMPAPLSVYGRSKLEAERLVAAAPLGTILRITNVFDVGLDDRNFLVRLVASLRERRPTIVPDDQLATPTYATWLAAQALALIERRHLCAPGSDRILHVACDDLLSRFDFARRVALRLGADAGLVQGRATAALGQTAARPLRGGLRNARLKTLLEVSALPLDRALDDLAPRLRERRERN
jgi:dTDP-4-dehydrorhamnose reductase